MKRGSSEKRDRYMKKKDKRRTQSTREESHEKG
jgi:hypothetical protein